jgi:hypothetical protein
MGVIILLPTYTIYIKHNVFEGNPLGSHSCPPSLVVAFPFVLACGVFPAQAGIQFNLSELKNVF